MKVLQIYKDYYPPVKGGIESHMNILSNGLNDRGIDVEVLVANTEMKLERENINGIKITKVPQIGRFASAPLAYSFPYWLRKIGKNADILHFHFPNPTAEIAYLLSGLKNKKVIVTYHSDIIRQAKSKLLYAPFLKKFLIKTQNIIVSSPTYLKTSKTLKNYQSKCKIIPYGIDISQFNLNGNSERKILEIKKKYNVPIILFVGRFRYYKGVQVAIEAMQNIDAKLLLIGEGKLESKLKKQVNTLKLENKVIFLGGLNDEEKLIYLHACNIFVLPSIFRSEAFGIVQLEAMACSKPVISTELGTGTSFVTQHNKTGFIVKPNNVKELVDATNLLIKDPKLCEKFGKAGKKRVEKYFLLNQMVSNTENLYKSLS